MKTETIRNQLLTYFRENRNISWMLTVAPFILFLGPVQEFFTLLFSRLFSNFFTICQLASMTGLLLCFIQQKYYPVIAASILKMVYEICTLFALRISLNTLANFMLAMSMLVVSIIASNAVDNLAKHLKDVDAQKAETIRARNQQARQNNPQVYQGPNQGQNPYQQQPYYPTQGLRNAGQNPYASYPVQADPVTQMQPDVGYPQAPAPYPAQADPVTQMQPDVGYPQPPAPYPVQPDPITQMQPDVGDIQQNQSEDQTEDAKSVELSNQINDM